MSKTEQTGSIPPQDQALKSHLGLPESADPSQIREAIFEQLRNAHKGPELQRMVLEVFAPIFQAHEKFITGILHHLLDKAEKGKTSGIDALRLASIITTSTEFSERIIGAKVAEGKSYDEVLQYISETCTLEQVQKWLLENPEIQKEYGKMEWF